MDPTTQCPLGPGLLTITKEVTCNESVQNQSICTASLFNQYPTIVFGTDPNPGFFNIGDQEQQLVLLSPGDYAIREFDFVKPPPQACSNVGTFDSGREAQELGSNILICAELVGDCSGSISEGQTGLQCDIENIIIQAPQLVVQKEWFVCDNDDIDCTIQGQGGGQTSFESPNSGNYTQCTSEQDCPFANDVGFEIEITGNSPTPNTFPALINTNQDVFVGEGPFTVSEELFSNHLVLDAIEVEDVPVGEIGTIFPALILAFDEGDQRIFTANFDNDSVSIIELNNANNELTIPLSPSGGNGPSAIAFDEGGQRIFTANLLSDSVSIIELNNANNVINVPLAPTGGDHPRAIAFDPIGQRVFTANFDSDSVSIIDLNNANNVIDVDLTPSGASNPIAIAFDPIGQRVFTANFVSDSVSVIELDNANNVIDVDLTPSGGNEPVALAVDGLGQKVYTANRISNSISIIELNNANNVIDIPLSPSGGDHPSTLILDEADHRAFTANLISDSVSIIDLPTISEVCQNSGFDTGDIRIFVSGQQTLEQITCVNFGSECSGEIEQGETKECTVQDYAVRLNDISNGINILSDSIQQQLTENINTEGIMAESIFNNEK